MALRFASVLGAGCLSLQPWSVLGNDAKDWEYFPLSGGIDNGVQATIKATIKPGGTAKIEFVDRERKSAFSFHVDTALQVVTRSADASFNGVTETFGKWPVSLAAGENTFVFTKRKFDMAVSIHETGAAVRFPWYDFGSTTTNLLTHVRVNSEGDNAGVENPEVTLERPTCSNTCHPDECRDASGASVCSDPNGCKAVEMGDQAGVAKQCSASTTTTAGGSMHCCDGSDVTPKPRGTLTKDSWAVVSSSTSYLQRLCTAFEVAPCPTELAGKNVQISNATSAPSSYEVFAPSLVSAPTDWPEHAYPTEAFKTLTSFALFQAFDNNKVVVNLPKSFTSAQFNADAWHDVITTSAEAKGQYVHLIEWWLYGPMVTKFTRRARDLIASFNSSKVYASDHPIPLPADSCTDMPFTDTAGEDCTQYTAELCTSHGFPTAAGCTKWNTTYGAGCHMPSGSDANGNPLGRDAAGLMCCVCGGGIRSPPSGWPSSSLEIVM